MTGINTTGTAPPAPPQRPGFLMSAFKFAAKAGIMLGAAGIADEVVLGGTIRDSLSSGITNTFNNAASLNPFDLAVELGKNYLDPGTAKILAGVLMLSAGSAVAGKIGGMMGITTLLATVTGITALGMNSSEKNNLDWSSEKDSFLTSGKGGYADFAKKYFPEWSSRMGGP